MHEAFQIKYPGPCKHIEDNNVERYVEAFDTIANTNRCTIRWRESPSDESPRFCVNMIHRRQQHLLLPPFTMCGSTVRVPGPPRQ